MATQLAPHQQFYIFGNCNMVPDHYDEWQAAYDKLAEHVMANEPETLTYYFGLPLEYAANPSATPSMLAFEAYASRAALYDVHLQSKPMQEGFLPVASRTMSTGLDLTHYEAVEGSFLDRSGHKTECGIIHDVQITCTGPEARKSLVGALTLFCTLVNERQGPAGEDGEVLSFLGLVSLDNETGARIFARYASREVWERWLRETLVTKFWESVKPYVSSVDARPYAPNGKGWLWK
ncbi:uncharacterized protein F5Z01DRAFT_21032 [Emericellopsis atlantica]|uniref:ABM domain-containing protein n=1 Tax=Emericellopsis atlantica TaxID=2614577 RepID=A0A9P8CUA8_9HYPO|nr:uncharacterized protein F5Z01DRAFT_21032 [Emericellopsis atlantica]KAG9259032.1 hypothetical protein F5Z01DRAFT_21032 [Emericellopsis atlantica]